MPVAAKRLFIVDAMAMAFRSFYAFGVRPMTTSSGQPTAAVFGSALFMHKLITEQQPDYLVIACDSKEKTFRHDLYKEYKANRTEMPEDLAAQMTLFASLMASYGAPFLRVPGMEADDIIGTLAKRFAADDLHVYIVSGDKDFMQLVDDKTFIYTPKKGEDALIIGRDGVKEKFGVEPNQVIDCLAIIGDASDNVPGVHGIGDKGAAKLIGEFGSLDGIYANLEAVTNKKQRNALEEYRERAYLSQDLVTIRTSLDLPCGLDDMACDHEQAVANDKLLQLFRQLEFKSMAARVESALGLMPEGGLLPNRPDAFRPLINAPKALPTPEHIGVDTPGYILINKREDLARVAKLLSEVREFCFDTETTGLDLLNDQPIGISFSVVAGQAYYIPLAYKHLTDMTPEEVLKVLRPILAKAGPLKVGHNLKFDIEMLANIDVDVQGPFVDTMIADWLLDAGGRQHGLDACCLRHLNYEKVKTKTLIGDKGERSMLDADLKDLTRYACEDADLTLRLGQMLMPKIAEAGLSSVFREIEMPLIPVLVRMERAGIFIDKEHLSDFSKELGEIQTRLEALVHQEAGEVFNLNSPKQLGEILFNKLKVHEQLGVKYLKKTKTGFSTDESVLQKLAAHPLAKALLEFRTVSKLKGTYVDALPQLVHQKSGRIHTSFLQTGTATGRLSSVDPNLQNIPIRTALGREIRKAFRAPHPDTVMLSADYSQIELRILAHLAGETALTKAFEEGADIHRLTAAKVFGVEPRDVDAEMRNRAKAINFGIIYGMGPRRLAADTGVSMQEAAAFIDKYFASYPGISKFIDQSVASAKEKGESRTITGRRRFIVGIDAINQRDLAAAENIAVNSPIQGSAADLIKLAMIRIDQRLATEKLRTKMLLQVHDELVFECPRHEVEKAKALIKECMEGAMKLSVPLAVEIGEGANWLEAH